MKRRLLTLGLAATLFFGTSACSPQEIQAKELTAGVQAGSYSSYADFEGPMTQAVTEFSLRLFQQTMQDRENTLVSPISVLTALAMTANGAKGETLDQMERAFGFSVQELNQYLHEWRVCLGNYEATVKSANSLWFKENGGLLPTEDFLQACVKWYEAQVYEAPFDQSTVKDVNLWVEENTDGMIQEILSDIPVDAVLYLINTLVFDAQWQKIYYDFQVEEDTFTREDGVKQTAEFMRSNEDLYWEDELSTGVMKYYEGGVYAFVGLLPKEGVTLEAYVDSLTGEALQEMLNGFTSAVVQTKLPKFQSETSAELSQVLQEMGMINLFDPVLADLSGMGTTSTGMLYVSQVLHKTFINVDERGTQAGAATLVEAGDGAAMPQDIKQVYLDRPFLYMIVNTRHNIPLFIGTLTDIT